MPQMAPMSWITLMAYFSLIMIMIMTIIFFSLIPNLTQVTKNTTSKIQQTWKW
uniref:ATP synthase F0 subunit 8 n=1 Tax=Myrmecophilus manni TaxID=270849 RepID=B6DE90_9ORTH|nr:ATP synthase F0 subunit 8 [Myrmecophilus manni]ACG59286.1 ATP synthase F0 subunit 8 [Myrmecophilus manni]